MNMGFTVKNDHLYGHVPCWFMLQFDQEETYKGKYGLYQFLGCENRTVIRMVVPEKELHFNQDGTVLFGNRFIQYLKKGLKLLSDWGDFICFGFNYDIDSGDFHTQEQRNIISESLTKWLDDNNIAAFVYSTRNPELIQNGGYTYSTSLGKAVCSKPANYDVEQTLRRKRTEKKLRNVERFIKKACDSGYDVSDDIWKAVRAARIFHDAGANIHIMSSNMGSSLQDPKEMLG